MENKLEKLKKEILEKLSQVKESQLLRDLEIKYLGRKGELTKVLRDLKNLGPEQRKEIGRLANEVKEEIKTGLKRARKGLEGEGDSSDFIDVTLPGEKIEKGHLNPITIIQNELEDLFSSMGFMIFEGPELESDHYNFSSLNYPLDHPARDAQDTFYIDHKDKDERRDLLMRTQMTQLQVRAMQKYGAPLRRIMPGRTFRAEATDACHEHTFYQMDGFMVDKETSIAEMIAVMKQSLEGILRGKIETRVRPGYFPFVEPGIEIDMKCAICQGQGCPSCKNSGWIEILPGGMIHPNVLRQAGLDPKEYNGFAFCVGLTRLAMMRYGINDIRLFNSGDLRFLEQF
ncbi:phenylalanine--tRNA ligase subunit alpha [Candidatus Falkowbacteria bacterium CG11_big_fil_rev_8_21_14_0_20_39_10]|uniref:Phenylalanine--tRNA ligase alpha subunit n=1 Tax=Candidatus Falkowbacteria bacterium CG11_big_fil_rev_8_21_14_0_20_39_10 TaxID=1974570 RepID=A0A2M6K8M4_9BACT|nr:MAG: phenylalanine--tRNA ligase subunit alpha [Candidatus Falkowbacteria bacterium CG11_big_fil_rev_8_21_14_0_20_39_10]